MDPLLVLQHLPVLINVLLATTVKMRLHPRNMIALQDFFAH